MKKLSVLAVGAVGYVLGSRAGRERYEQIKNQATKFWNTPTVQKTVDDVQTHAKHAASDVGSKVGSKVAETATEVKDRVVEKVTHQDNPVATPSAHTAAHYAPPEDETAPAGGDIGRSGPS